MKILIISDTHRKHENLLKVLERECPVDLLIHLGDAEGYEDYIAEQAGCPVEVVAGNNDFFFALLGNGLLGLNLGVGGSVVGRRLLLCLLLVLLVGHLGYLRAMRLYMSKP